MLESRLTIEIPGLAEALNNLAAALTHGRANTPPAAPVRQPPAAPVIAPPAPVQQPPAPAPIRAVPQAPVAPAPSFTHDQVGKAGADLIALDPGKREILIGMLTQYGVRTISELKPEQLGPFATALRGLGGKI